MAKTKAKRFHETWEHGIVRVTSSGEKTYYIREQRLGRRYEVSTRTGDHRMALKEYASWSANTDGYRPGRLMVSAKAVLFTQELVDEFLARSEEDGNSAQHLINQRSCMKWWMGYLKGRDIRRLDMARDLLPPLRRTAQNPRKRAVLKSFCTWLRSEDKQMLDMQEDPTLQMKVPQHDPTKRKTLNKAVAYEDLTAVRNALNDADDSWGGPDGKWAKGHSEAPWRSMFTVQMATGWHVTELRRFAKDGVIEPYSGPQKGVVGVLVYKHKEGDFHRTAVDAETLKAAKVVHAYGSFSPGRYSDRIMLACEDAGVAPFGGGRLRHSVATHLVNQGADLGRVSTFLNHRSPATTRRFYATHATPFNPGLLASLTEDGGDAK